ncbi:MAG: hypothetical protein V1678_04105 [Candidatus Aenigmatarchaeota archaeon]
MSDLLNMVCPPGSACPLTAMGIPEILLWVLSFAVIFGILSKVGIFKGRAANTLVSVAIAFLVLMAVPAALITVIASMSTSLMVVAIAFIVVLSLIEIAGAKPRFAKLTDKGWAVSDPVHPFEKHGTLVAIALIVLTAIIFWASGGAALLGLSALPVIGASTWLLIVVGGAVLWMLSGA